MRDNRRNQVRYRHMLRSVRGRTAGSGAGGAIGIERHFEAVVACAPGDPVTVSAPCRNSQAS